MLLLMSAFIASQALQFNKVRTGKLVTVEARHTTLVQARPPVAYKPLADLARLNLMGDASKAVAPAPPVEKIPAAANNLTLMGIISSTVENKSSVLIQDGTLQTKRYYLGQTMENGSVVQSIESDKVLLKRGEKLEELRYPVSAANTSSVYQPSSVMQQPVPVQPLTTPAVPVVQGQQPMQSVNPNPGQNPDDLRARLYRLPPTTPGGHPREQ